MSLVLTVPAADADTKFAPAPAGVWPAVCTKIIDVGTQTEEYQGKVSSSRKLIFVWEIDSDERMADGRPFTVQKWYTASLGQKANLRKLLLAWFGKVPEPGSFDLTKLLGRPCQIQVVHEPGKDGDVRAKVQSVMPLSKGMKGPQPSITPFLFSLDAFDEDTFSILSDFQKGKIAASPEYKAIMEPPPKPAAKPAPAVPTGKLIPVQPAHVAAGFGGPKPAPVVAHDDDFSDEIPF